MNTYASNEERGWMRDGPPRDKRATSARERERERERENSPRDSTSGIEVSTER